MHRLIKLAVIVGAICIEVLTVLRIGRGPIGARVWPLPYPKMTVMRQY
jgi:hypothetical protein